MGCDWQLNPAGCMLHGTGVIGSAAMAVAAWGERVRLLVGLAVRRTPVEIPARVGAHLRVDRAGGGGALAPAAEDGVEPLARAAHLGGRKVRMGREEGAHHHSTLSIRLTTTLSHFILSYAILFYSRLRRAFYSILGSNLGSRTARAALVEGLATTTLLRHYNNTVLYTLFTLFTLVHQQQDELARGRRGGGTCRRGAAGGEWHGECGVCRNGLEA